MFVLVGDGGGELRVLTDLIGEGQLHLGHNVQVNIIASIELTL